jgi:hypothetical protein
MDMFQVVTDIPMAVHMAPRRLVRAQLPTPGKTHGIGWCSAPSKGGKQGQALKKAIFILVKSLCLQPFVNRGISGRILTQKQQRSSLQFLQSIVEPVYLLEKNRSIPF